MKEEVEDLIKQGLVPANYDEIGRSKFPLTWKKLDRVERHIDCWPQITILLFVLWAELMLFLYIHV
ncbi:MAG: hypothetical protein IB616_01195 [Methanosarcinales archaeon]|nr:MAG: hypothetical protein IB616_01195 [Methanosarcinales archaeon]